MALCQLKHLYNRALTSSLGLTLVEVLIALAIVAIAMTAITKAISENIRATAYLQNKTQSMWVGQYILNEVRAGILKLPDSSDKLKNSLEILNKNWYWQAYQEETPNQRIRKIIVNVYETDDEEAKPMMMLESYMYRDE
ncbi:MAG: type II secretion system minor pseudopilin GspI [Gammaproteobacteria bacterium]|nr:type II secretion system minor pseudopilin GspI [Gammaproteobacteria bacterium]